MAIEDSPAKHRVSAAHNNDMCAGSVSFAIVKSLWFYGMTGAAIFGGLLNFTWDAFVVFLIATAFVLLFGHSLGSHRKLIHNSYQCPKWLEYLFVYCGVQAGLAGPIGLLKQHELRDYAQRLPECHDYLRHGRSFWRDAWWQLSCNLHFASPPKINIESSITHDRFYRFLEHTWMLQHLVVAALFYSWGGWPYLFWGVCARVSTCIIGHWLIGFFAHNLGEMRYRVRGAAVQGRNVRFTSLLTMGECWHNNHHAYPGSARLGLLHGQWDPGWWTLVALHRCGLVWDIVLPMDLPRRQELEILHSHGKYPIVSLPLAK